MGPRLLQSITLVVELELGWWHGFTLTTKYSASSWVGAIGLHGPIYVTLDHNGPYLYQTLIMDVRLLLFSICVFGEDWSLGSLYTFIRRSRLVSRGPHSQSKDFSRLDTLSWRVQLRCSIYWTASMVNKKSSNWALCVEGFERRLLHKVIHREP